MWIIKLEANPNGSHDDLRSSNITKEPDGWAVIPEGFELPASFPFVNIEAHTVVYKGVDEDGQEYETEAMTVTAMTEGEVPELEPEPGPDVKPLTVWDELDAAYREGVNDI